MRIEKQKRKKTTADTVHMFSNADLRSLLIPLIVEQLLTALMGTVDTIMVSNVGSEAISAVSLVDSINVLVIQALSALAAGGTVICAQYLGYQKKQEAQQAAQQVVFIVTVISLTVTAACLIWRMPLLRLIFGKVDELVMENSGIYFFYTALSFPFIALYNAGASIFRAKEDSRTPMTISVISNLMNIGGNAVLIWVFNMGVGGAAIATLVSRVFSAVVVMACLHRPEQELAVRNYLSIRPDAGLIKKILFIGIPSGFENSMFQFGKLAIQSTVSTMGTVAIAAQAMTAILENLSGIGAIGIGIGLMTIVGQAMGAGRKDEAVYYVKKLTVVGEAVVVVSVLLVFAATWPVTVLGGMEAESAKLCFSLMCWISLVKPFAWTLSFIPAYGMRAAGDVRFSMLVTTISMWAFRVSLCVLLARSFGFGPIAVWIGMFADWTVRGIVFAWRFHSRKWLNHNVVRR